MQNQNAKKVDPQEVTTGVVRLSYTNIWEPKPYKNGKPKYSVSLIIKKSDTETIESIKKAVQVAYDEGQGTLKGNGKSVPTLASLKTPLRDGDEERPDDEAYANSYFVTASSYEQPGVVDINRKHIIERAEIYSGIYARASVRFYAYNNDGRGIACGLNHIQKVKNGPPLGGKGRVEDAFDDGFTYDDVGDDDDYLY